MIQGQIVEVSYMRRIQTVTVKVMRTDMDIFELPDEPVVVLTTEEFSDLKKPQVIELPVDEREGHRI